MRIRCTSTAVIGALVAMAAPAAPALAHTAHAAPTRAATHGRHRMAGIVRGAQPARHRHQGPIVIDGSQLSAALLMLGAV